MAESLHPSSTYVLNLFQQYHDEVLAVLRARLRSEEDAADVLQEAYARLLSLPHAEAIRHPRAFFYTTALNLAVDSLRRRHTALGRHLDLESAQQVASAAPDLESVVDAKERLMMLHAAIAELPPKCRQVFLLHKFKELPHSEIASRLGISRNMVEKHVIKALAHCRKRLDESLEQPRQGRAGVARHTDERDSGGMP